jgi:hypothetical protein
MRFRYLKDPLFLFCVCLYFLNRWVLKPCLPNEFSRCHVNDLICIPFWVPIMLFVMRKTGLRNDDVPPRPGEILVPLLVWSWTFELFLPHTELFRHLATADHLDILAYTIGAIFAAVFWRYWYVCRQWKLNR